jgi:bifunctional DNA-binding transcriptional regulator/antitoxin component of YhaV-PrlF toxin-antitoxin module
MSVARVQAHSRVTVPRNIREACGIHPGSELLFTRLGPDTFMCRVLPARQSFLDVLRRYTVSGVAPDLDRERERMGDEMAREGAAARDGEA